MVGRQGDRRATGPDTHGVERAYRLLIGGERVGGELGSYPVVNPATELVVGHAPQASATQVSDAVAAAAEAFPAWSRTPPDRRAELLGRAAELFMARSDELVPLVQAETGATLAVSSTMQVPMCGDRLRRAARGALEPNVIALPPGELPTTPLAPGALINAIATRQPVGVVACITPYNFPIVNMAGKIGPALAMGNTVVVKPAPQDPLAVTMFGEILDEAGFPPGVVNVITGSGADVGEALVTSPAVDMVSFTGSTAVGRRIAEQAGGAMKRLLLELGGKGAALVFDDADLETAIATISNTWMFHSGQTCTAPTRLLAHRRVHDELVARLQALAARLRLGDPCDANTVVGPVISAPHRERVERHVAIGLSEGATLATGGARPDIAPGYYVQPTLLVDCRAGMRVVEEEIFGPVIVALSFDDDDEAVDLANSTEYGLQDYVFTADITRAMRVAGRLRSGNVSINTILRNHEAPFGGFKQSGVGRDGGSFGLHAYSELQSVMWRS
jgi:phenylacetaldehyde dehydrogenase